MSSILSVAHWKTTKAYRNLTDTMTQTKYYTVNGSAPEVLKLVDLESKPFGTVCEVLISEIFQMSPRSSSQNDGTRKNVKIEIKCARYWAGKDDCKWQHLEPDHDYEVALLCLLGFQGWNVWAVKKSVLMGEMRDKKIVTFQGKQGYWLTKEDALPYLTIIESVADLDAFLETV